MPTLCRKRAFVPYVVGLSIERKGGLDDMGTPENIGSGYIKLYRSALPWIRNHKLWAFWCYCLMKASHQVHKMFVGNQQIELQPGQFIFGRRIASQETGLSERKIRTSIESLRKSQNMTIKTTNKFSIITVVNWSFYQGENEKTTSKTTSKRPATDHKQECNNKNLISPDAFKLSEKLLSLILTHTPGYVTPEKKEETITRWAKDVDKLIRLDGRTPETVQDVIEWAQGDAFWMRNILSGSKLREKFPQLLVKMGTGNHGGNGKDTLPDPSDHPTTLDKIKQAENGVTAHA